jgi:uncharacterized protein YdeI (YjbR/CyaY-like superfamily)
MNRFSAKIQLIGINPYVLLPAKTLNALFKQAGKGKGKIPVKIKIDGHEFIQTLIKYSGHWRLYLNTPMRKAAKKEVGDKAVFEIEFDPAKRIVPAHPKLTTALKENPAAKKVFDGLPPSRRGEIIRYISNLKTEEAIDKNIKRALNFLQNKERFIGRDKP